MGQPAKFSGVGNGVLESGAGKYEHGRSDHSDKQVNRECRCMSV